MSNILSKFYMLQHDITVETGTFDSLVSITVSDELFDLIFLECLAQTPVGAVRSLKDQIAVRVYGINFIRYSSTTRNWAVSEVTEEELEGLPED